MKQAMNPERLKELKKIKNPKVRELAKEVERLQEILHFMIFGSKKRKTPKPPKKEIL